MALRVSRMACDGAASGGGPAWRSTHGGTQAEPSTDTEMDWLPTLAFNPSFIRGLYPGAHTGRS